MINRVFELTGDQWGLVTRKQLEIAGVPRTTIERLTGPNAALERVAFGVYRLTGSPIPDHLDLRAAWLQLAPGIPAWKRSSTAGVVSHQSAAALYGVGHLPVDRHEFTVGGRKQTRRTDVRIHERHVAEEDWIVLRGLPVTRPSRIASDLLFDNQDPASIGQIIADSIDNSFDYPSNFAASLTSHAGRFGMRRGDGLALLRWLLEIVGNKDTELRIREARNSLVHESPGQLSPSVAT